MELIERTSRAIALTILLPLVALASTGTHAAPSSGAVGFTTATFFDGYQGAIARFSTWLLDGDDQSPSVAVVVVPRERTLTVEKTPEVEKFLRFYTQGRGRVTARVGLERSQAYRDMAEQIFREEGIPVELIWLAQVESNWIASAESHARARGMWQFIPETGERFGLDCGGTNDERDDVEKATRAAAKYLKFLGKRYEGDWLLAMGAYNCGEGGMDRAIERSGGRSDFWELSRRDLLPNETANYVPAVLATIEIASNPTQYGLA